MIASSKLEDEGYLISFKVLGPKFGIKDQNQRCKKIISREIIGILYKLHCDLFSQTQLLNDFPVFQKLIGALCLLCTITNNKDTVD